MEYVASSKSKNQVGHNLMPNVLVLKTIFAKKTLKSCSKADVKPFSPVPNHLQILYCVPNILALIVEADANLCC